MSHARTRRTLPIIALNIAIVLLLGGGTAAYGAMSNSVTLTVDGSSHTIRTFGSSVAEVLTARDVDVRPADKVSLDAGHQLSDGDDIEVSFAKPVTLSVDGTVTEHTVYEQTVSDALDDLAVDVPEDAFVSEDPDAALNRTDNTLVVSTTKDLVVKADGEKHELSTTAPTVGMALQEAGVALGSDDEVEPSIFSFVEPDQKITVVRIKKVEKTETVPVDFKVDAQKDPEASQGEVDVVTRGVKGENREKVELVYADGKLRERNVLDREVLSKPVTQVEKRGTKVEPVSGVWAALAKCESGGNPRANNGNKYFGLYQFSIRTWQSVGGSGNPADASPSEQTKRAKILQAKAGWGQWPSCSKKIGVR